MDRVADQLAPERLLADSRWLRSLARGLVGEVSADDLVQETWLSVLRRPPRFLTNLRPWLRTVARNLSIRDGQRQYRRRQREARSARAESLPSAADLVARATLRRSVVHAVLELAEPYRSTILLRFFEELPPREVARRQGVPVATVRTRLSRGLDQLKSRLDHEHGEQRVWIALLVPTRGLVGAWWLAGAIVMGTKLKVACVAAALVLGALGWWQWSRWSLANGDGELAQVPPVVHDSPVSGANPTTSPVVVSRSASDAIRSQPYREDTAADFAIVGVAIDNRTGRPVEGIVSTITGWGENPETVASDTVTDREGRFRIPVHEKNRVRSVTLLSPDYAPLVLDHVENDVRRSVGNTLDVGVLRLLRGTRVSGRVTSAETKGPIADARLFVSPRGYAVSQTLLAEARPAGESGPDGKFVLPERVAPPPPGWDREVILSAVIPDGVGWAFLPIVHDREALDGVEVVIARGATVRVVVVDGEEKPVEGALISAAPRFPPLGPPQSLGSDYAHGWVQEAVREHFMQKSGADGTVVFRGLPIGRAEERFKRDHSSPTAYSLTALHPAFVQGEPLNIKVDPKIEVSTKIKLVPRRLCTIHGRVTSESGVPIEGARIEERGMSALATTDKDGNYRLEGRDTANGWIGLEVRADGHAKLWRRIPLAVTAEDVVADFVLQKAAPIAGRVIDQDGRPVASAYVDLYEGTGQAAKQLRPDGGDLDAEGRFVFSDATAGPWKLRVHAEPSEDWGNGRDRIVQGGDRNVEVVLRRRPAGHARLEAEIVEATTGNPIDPAEAHLRMVTTAVFSGDYSTSARTQLAAGRVAAQKLRPGTWSLFVRLADGNRANREFVVRSEDGVVKLRVEVGKPGTVVVRIDRTGMAENAQPSAVHVWTVPGDAVQWMTQPGVIAPRSTRGFGTADHSNEWTVLFGDVTPNTPIRFWITSQGGKPCFAQEVVTVGFGEEKEIVLRPVVSARVTFRKPAHAPSGGVIVSIKARDGTWYPINRSSIWEEGKGWSDERQVLPGHLFWRAERYSLESDPAERSVAGVVQGELHLSPGDAREIPIVFPN